MDNEPIRMELDTNENTQISKGCQDEDIVSSLICNEELENSLNFHNLEISEEIKDTEGLWKPKRKEYLKDLLNKESEYIVNPLSFQEIQTEISSAMRAILIDWMMEVCSEYTLKRETFHLAISHLNRAISIIPNIKQATFQLLGVAAMSIACKSEEVYIPRLCDFAKASDKAYDESDIQKTEKDLLKALQWKIYPPTSLNCLNCLLEEWDHYIMTLYGGIMGNTTNDYQMADEKEKISMLEKRMILYHKKNENSYRRYREMMQILDVANLDFGVVKFKISTVVGGIVYLMVNKAFYETDYELIRWDGARMKSFGEIDTVRVVHEILEYFLCNALELGSIEEIYPGIQYFQKFVGIHFTYEHPVACKYLTPEELESHYENYLAYQTYSPTNLRQAQGCK